MCIMFFCSASNTNKHAIDANMSSVNQFRATKHPAPCKKPGKNDKTAGNEKHLQTSATSGDVAALNPHDKVKKMHDEDSALQF